MNHLAHFYLAGNDPEVLLGTVMGDFVRGTALEGFPEPVRRGIILHRKIDAFTDTHPVCSESRRLISRERCRYAGILVDVFFDHFLARRWSEHSGTPLPEYAEGVYAALREHRHLLPPDGRGMIRRMAQEDWLSSYARVEGVEQALGRVATRIRRENPVASGGEDLRREYGELEARFDRFFPELVAFARTAA